MSETNLRRPVYIKALKEMNLSKIELLKLVKHLDGMPESPMHWFQTYWDYHAEQLVMKQEASDSCLWYKKVNGNTCGILALQVDDTLIAGNTDFIDLKMDKFDDYHSFVRNEVSKSRLDSTVSKSVHSRLMVQSTNATTPLCFIL